MRITRLGDMEPFVRNIIVRSTAGLHGAEYRHVDLGRSRSPAALLRSADRGYEREMFPGVSVLAITSGCVVTTCSSTRT